MSTRITHSLGVSMKYGLDGRLQRGLRARDQILPAALRAFACEGFTGLSLARLAEELGMGKSTLLHHFASKEQLYGAVLAQVAESLEAHMQPLLEQSHATPQALAQMACSYLQWAREQPEAANLLNRELLDNPERAATAKHWHLQKLMLRLSDLVSVGQARGYLRHFNPALGVEMLLGFAHFHVAATATRQHLIGAEAASRYEAQAHEELFQTMILAFAQQHGGPHEA